VLLAGVTGKTPVGMLRRVLALETAADGTTVAKTEPAILQHAFKKLHVWGEAAAGDLADGRHLDDPAGDDRQGPVRRDRGAPG
jgi:hypothetical protein